MIVLNSGSVREYDDQCGNADQAPSFLRSLLLVYASYTSSLFATLGPLISNFTVGWFVLGKHSCG